MTARPRPPIPWMQGPTVRKIRHRGRHLWNKSCVNLPACQFESTYSGPLVMSTLDLATYYRGLCVAVYLEPIAETTLEGYALIRSVQTDMADGIFRATVQFADERGRIGFGAVKERLVSVFNIQTRDRT